MSNFNLEGISGSVRPQKKKMNPIHPRFGSMKSSSFDADAVQRSMLLQSISRLLHRLPTIFGSCRALCSAPMVAGLAVTEKAPTCRPWNDLQIQPQGRILQVMSDKSTA